MSLPVAHKFKDQGVVVLAVCTSDTRDKFEEFVKANRATYPDTVFTCDPNVRGAAALRRAAGPQVHDVVVRPGILPSRTARGMVSA